MELAELLHRVTSALEELDIPCLVTGWMATIAYGEPALTKDIEVVVRIERQDIGKLRSVFPESESEKDLRDIERVFKVRTPTRRHR